MPLDYNQTINLPKTDFPMRASLPKREPAMLEQWQEKQIYERLMEHNEGKPHFILHDGPPFSNGYIHMGTAMNKCLKDFILRYKNMSGYHAPYTPGWDNHGMPIESAIIKQNKLDRKKMSIPEFRDACRDFADDFVDIQRDQFKRLGVLGDWEHPYLTMDPSYEAKEVELFGSMYEKGYIYKGLKPVYWCAHDETALAEAEIEYADDPCNSLYVKFKVKDDKGLFSGLCDLSKTYFLIWTTTPWTLPGNLAISLGPDFTYVLMEAPNGEVYIVAQALAEGVAKAAGLESWTSLGQFKGRDLELMTASHPIYDRDSVVLVGNHVTLEAGTGCVHTAPGHGMDDFLVCKRYDDAGKTKIGVLVPVDSKGHMTEEAGPFAGMFYAKANGAIIEHLTQSGALYASEHLEHSYPHCWRCKKPIIYRATDQWFCSVDAFKEEAAAACDDVRWLPEWGHDRMVSMILERSEWCISRQRHWGLPIPVFYCEACHKPVCTPETISSVSQVFKSEGSNAWFDKEASALLPSDFACPHCGGSHFTKETDTLDCWFDSGSSHIASLTEETAYQWPSHLYLEGADQYRGWFQSSLLTAVSLKGRAPYSIVLTHGWTVDGEGKAMHKSLGNTVLPEDMIKQYGADLVRLWAASADYRVDVRVSTAIFKQLSDIYLKIRNTARYILGNLNGFDPDNATPFSQMEELDQWALTRFNQLAEKVASSYENYTFHLIYHAIHNFCVIDMSNFYLDILKDRLYCEGENSSLRRSAQSAIYFILDGMVRMLAPILAFTSEEIWSFMPHHKEANAESVLLNDMPSFQPELTFSPEKAACWDSILALRTDVNKAMEIARAEKLVGKSLDCNITLHVGKDAADAFSRLAGYDLQTLLIVSKVTVASGSEAGAYQGTAFPGLSVDVQAATAPKCSRCWCHHEEIGADQEHEALCPRCADVVKAI